MSKIHTVGKPGVMAGKVPQIMQMEALECGAASLAMVCAYYGKWVPLEQVRADCGVSRDGSSALKVLRAARHYGFEASGYRYEPDTLRDKVIFPCIVHWDFNHFIVVRGFKGDKVYVNDPARGDYSMSFEEFDRGFTGICLSLTPGPDFKPEGEPASIKDFAMERLKGTGPAIAFVAITVGIISLLGIVNPALSQIFLDRLLTGEAPSWFWPFIGIVGTICGIQIVVSILNAIYLLKLEGKLAVVSNVSFIWRVLHLPMEFFSQRDVGDINQRAQSSQMVASQMVGTLAPLIIDFLMLIIYVIIMFTYSWLLSLIGIASVVANLLVARFISAKRVNITRVQMRDQANLVGATAGAIEMIETLKSSGAEQGYFQRWSGFQAGANTQGARFVSTDVRLSLIPQMVTSFANVMVLVAGLWLTFQGQFTIGMILAFQGYLQSFVTPAQNLTLAMQQFQEMRTSMERIQDVMDYPVDPLSTDDDYEPEGTPAETVEVEDDFSDLGIDLSSAPTGLAKLSGAVDLDGITFGYSPLDPPLIEDFSLHVKAGGSVAFVGSSGSGKSTLSKLISGLYEPWSGEVRFDGVPMRDVPKAVRTGSVAVIDQDIILFNDTISNNIRLWDDSIEDFEVILAARDARIHDVIMEKDGGYEHKLLEGGRDLSGGQRQRMEIARALAQEPTILIMDEATSALDAETELEVMENIKKRGLTLVIIAHRLSAIRDCDEIVVLDKGRVVERGTHEELYKAGGTYAKLIATE